LQWRLNTWLCEKKISRLGLSMAGWNILVYLALAANSAASALYKKA
jgi:disulfide bond formation protein DsbB